MTQLSRFALSLAVFLCGCSAEEKKDDANPDLQLGTYLFSGASLASDECDAETSLWDGDVAGEYDGGVYEVTAVSDESVTIADVELARTGNTFSLPRQLQFEFDWMDLYGLACQEEDYSTITFTIVDDVTLDYEELWEYVALAGSDGNACILANDSAWGATVTEWPCETVVTGDLLHEE